MKNVVFLFLSIIFIGTVSCNDPDEVVSPDTVFTYGLECGWCADLMELNVNSDSILFKSSPEAGNCEFEEFTNATSNEVFIELIALLNFDAFKLIEINTHNIGHDGCDWYLKIEKGLESHSIRYGYSDTVAIQPILPLIEKLEEIAEGY